MSLSDRCVGAHRLWANQKPPAARTPALGMVGTGQRRQANRLKRGWARPRPKRRPYSQPNVRTYMRPNPINESHIVGRARHYNVGRKRRLPLRACGRQLANYMPETIGTAASPGVAKKFLQISGWCKFESRRITIHFAFMAFNLLPISFRSPDTKTTTWCC
jgi:hypothetical protein